MTDEEHLLEIKRLAYDAAVAAERFEAISAANTYGLSGEEKFDIRVKYEQAKAELFRKQHLLSRAQYNYVVQGPPSP